MHIHAINPEFASDNTIRCAHCWDHDATHIELTHTGEHDPVEHVVVCRSCGHLAGLKACPGCNIGPKVTVVCRHLFGDLIPLYAPEELDEGGHCAWHLGLAPQRPQPEIVALTSIERTG